MAAINPYCEAQWPHEEHSKNSLTAGLLEAICGARACADLLLVDANLAGDIADADEPDSLPRPFTAATAHGLRMALNVCLGEISVIADRLNAER